MNHFRTVILLILFLLPLFGMCNEFPPDNGCKETLLAYIEKMEGINAPEPGETYHVKYRMSTEYSKELDINSTETTTEVVTGKNKIMLHDKSMKVYGDDTNVFVVIPEQKKIYWNDSDPRIFNDTNNFKKFLEIQRGLINNAKDISCQEQDGKTIITVVPGDEFRKATKLVTQKIMYDNKLERIVKVDNTYNRFNKIKAQSIAYEVLDFNSSKKITPPIAALFKGKELRTIYKGFEIIDNRKIR